VFYGKFPRIYRSKNDVSLQVTGYTRELPQRVQDKRGGRRSLLLVLSRTLRLLLSPKIVGPDISKIEEHGAPKIVGDGEG
jgi:hypothetical protein